MDASIYHYMDKTKIYIGLPDGGKWVRGYLKEVLGKRVHLDWIRDKNGTVWWLVSRDHLETLTEALRSRYKSLYVSREYSTTQKCTGACQRARRDLCECSCAGQFHGGTDQTFHHVSGDLLISSTRRRVTRVYVKEVAA